MDINKVNKKEEKENDIIILDEGINTDLLMTRCCPVIIFPYRGI